MGGSARRVDVIADVIAVAHVPGRSPRRLAPSVLAGAVLLDVSRVEQPGSGHRPGRPSRSAARQCRTARAGAASADPAARGAQLRPQSRGRRVERTRRKPAGGVCRPAGIAGIRPYAGSRRVIVSGTRRHGPRHRLHPVPLGCDAPLDLAPAPTRIRSEGAVAPVSRCDPSAHGPRVSSARALQHSCWR